MLITLERVLDKDEVARFRAEIAGASWQDGARTAGTLAQGAKHNQQLDDGSELAIRLGHQILRKLGNDPRFIAAALPNRIHPPKFNRYAGGGNYGAHVDSAIMAIPGSKLMLRSDLSATLFLSEPEDYEGGELEIEDVYGVQSVKLPDGDLVLYPSSSLHQVTPVTAGERLASFFWVQSLVADDGARSLLYDLDQAIQALTPQVEAGSAELLKLTGVYHNLLRRWSQP